MFSRIAHRTAAYLGRPHAFIVAIAQVVLWLATGPVFNFSDTWQLIINTGTTVVTFLMVFLIQNTQNRDTLAIQTKLDELVRATPSASNKVMRIEDLSEPQLRATRRKINE